MYERSVKRMKQLIQRWLRWHRHADWLALQKRLAGVGIRPQKNQNHPLKD